MTDKLYTEIELMGILGIKSRNTLINMRKRGLPYIKIGKKLIRYDLNEVREWIGKGK